MKVLLRVTEWYDGQEYGLEENFTTEQLETLLPYHLLDRCNDMQKVIEYDIDKTRRRNQRTNDK